MTRYDSNGLPYAVQLGRDRPPVHPDGSAVVTARLWPKLSPVEQAIWSGDDLRAQLALRAFWITGGDLVDGWDAGDFASYGLEESVRRSTGNRGALSHWLTQEISRRRKRADKVKMDPLWVEDDTGNIILTADGPAEDFVPAGLPSHTRDWLDQHLSPRAALAVRLHIEQGLTQAEAATAAGLDRKTVQRAYETLRNSLRNP